MANERLWSRSKCPVAIKYVHRTYVGHSRGHPATTGPRRGCVLMMVDLKELKGDTTRDEADWCPEVKIRFRRRIWSTPGNIALVLLEVEQEERAAARGCVRGP